MEEEKTPENVIEKINLYTLVNDIELIEEKT